jgi:glycosyltransferase involved in cell wall biosynthesis
VVVGDVFYNDSYANNIKNLNDPRIIFAGYITNQDELAELYHNCFIYLHGHEFGGTNPAMLKALAYGCAVMALDTVFTREMLAGNRYGLLFNKDTDNLKSLIQRVENQKELLTNLRNKSRRRIIENYTWDKITEQYLTLFRNMMKKSVNQQIGEPLAKL